ncbi:hypothetical protein MP228_001344 [Amoeboaphelidium protococcarum]|nr:hypothetical protein MP228_001344 [Amoeboaphelidium protococcarum]
MEMGKTRTDQNEDVAMVTDGGGNFEGGGDRTCGSSNQFQREQVVRLALQCLNDLGYQQSVKILEKESGYKSETDVIGKFRLAILNGDWLQANDLMKELKMDPANVDQFKFLMYKQHFLELLEERNLKDALGVLRNDIATLSTSSVANSVGATAAGAVNSKDSLHQLSSLIMCSSVQDLKDKSGWMGKGEISRQQLFDELQALINPAMIIPQRRWEILYDQANQHQISKCLYHNSIDQQKGVSLFIDHECARDEFPVTTNVILNEHTDEIWYVAFSHGGKYLASASKDTTCIIWSAQSWQPVHTLTGHEDAICFLSWSPNDQMLLTCGNDVKLKLWNTETGTCIRTLQNNQDAISSCAWFSDNSRFVSSSLDKSIIMWDVDGRQLQRWSGARVSDLALTRDGKFMVAACHENKIRIYDMEKKSERVIEENSALTSLQLSHDDRYILVNLSNSEIHIWDLQKEQSVTKLSGHKQGKYVIRSCFGGAGQKFVASGSEDNNVYIWNWERNLLLETLSGHTSTVNSVSWNPQNSSMIASASDDCTIRVWGNNVSK